MSEFDRVYTVKKEFEKDVFLRQVLVSLGSNPETPIDVVNVSFDDVNERKREVLVCKATVDADYSASIGYDHEEKYWTKEKKYDADLKRDVYVDVEKTRTVTEWRPYSGHLTTDEVVATFNEDNPGYGDEEDTYIGKALRTVEDDSIVEKGEAFIANTALEEAKQTCRWYNESRISWPGDHVKDKNVRSRLDIQYINCYIMPFYETTFNYNGKKYRASGFACGDKSVLVEFPPNNADVVEIVNNETKQLKTTKLASWGGFILAFLASIVAMKVINFYWLWPLAAGVLVFAILSHIKYDKVYNEKLRALKEDVLSEKKSALENALGKHGYDILTTDEKKAFNVETGSYGYASKGNKKTKKWPIILAILAMVGLILVSFSGNSKAQFDSKHSIDKINVQVAGKTEEYKEYVQGYTNGMYYVYYDIKVTSKNVGLKNMQMKIKMVKNNQEIGTLTITLDNMNLDAGATKSYQVQFAKTPAELQYQDNSLFIEMYQSNLSDYKYVVEITSVNFDDGAYYYSR